MSSTRIGETGSKVTYECGCCIQRPSFHNLWVREYVCGEHKAAIMLPPDVFANPAKFVEFEPSVNAWVDWAENTTQTPQPDCVPAEPDNADIIKYSCGCTIVRGREPHTWEHGTWCREHERKVWPKSAPDQRSFEERWHEHQEKDAALTATVSSLTAEERDVVQAVIAMRQLECLRERRQVSRCYIEGETRRIRLEAIDAESEALSSAMKKLTC